MEDYEEHVHQCKQEDECNEPVDQVYTAVYSSVFRMILLLEIVKSTFKLVVLGVSCEMGLNLVLFEGSDLELT